MEHKASIVDGVEMHQVDDTLYLTSEKDGTQVALSPDAVLGMLKYLTEISIKEREQQRKTNGKLFQASSKQ